MMGSVFAVEPDHDNVFHLNAVRRILRSATAPPGWWAG